MEESMLHILSIIVTFMFISIAVFQVLLALGLPLGEFAMGGYYKVLPYKLRVASAINAIILLVMGVVFEILTSSISLMFCLQIFWFG